MTDATIEKTDTKEKITDADWANRRLCSDGNCIGVIGIDGCCKVCGKPYDGKLPDTGTGPSADAPPPENAIGMSPEQDAEPPYADTTDDKADSHWDNRKLCSDGNCIGVIGPDGRCKVCGKPYRS